MSSATRKATRRTIPCRRGAWRPIYRSWCSSTALQEAGRAKVIGETTFGTGTVLGEFDLSDGSALRVGTVEWLTPNGRRIWHEGIAPDVSIVLPNDVQPLTPEEVGRLPGAGIGTITDSQLAKALEVISTERVASAR